jgi:L,D-transpeptidase-like protein
MTRAARRLGVALIAGALLAGGLVVGSLVVPAGGTSRVAAGPAARFAAGARPAASITPAAARLPRGTSIVANVRGRTIAVYRRPGARRPERVLRRLGRPLVLLVRARRPGWLRVLLPVRPNGSQGWIRARDVVLRANPYELTIALKAHRLTLRRDNRVVMREPIGVGRAATPTPKGLAYVTELLRQPDPQGAYGPWAFGLSVYSPVLTSFGGGPGQVGLHGTNAPKAIGHDISHGCIRLQNTQIKRLAQILPLGTPVRITE